MKRKDSKKPSRSSLPKSRFHHQASVFTFQTLTPISTCPAFWKAFLVHGSGWLRTWAREGDSQPRSLKPLLHGQTASGEGDRKRKLTFPTRPKHRLWIK